MKLIDLLTDNNNYLDKSGKFPNSHGTDKEFLHGHHYVTSFYEEHFLPYKEQEIDLLEIGVQYGGSMFLWHDYFTKGNIYGVDIVDRTNPIINEYPRIKRYVTSAYDKSFADSLPEFDIIIDDGPHTLDSFIKVIELYLPKLKQNGMLVIEDIPNIKHIDVLVKMIPSYRYKVIDTREQYKRFDNIMLAIFN